ncbi:MAG: hypothetical protein RLZZ382_851 [Bacteroidota bacterium]|jgi:hypothetical protein
MQIKLFLVFLFYFTLFFSQKKQLPFSGELLFKAQRVIPMDSIQEHMLIYAKDSLLKVINFSSNMGKQELIKHLSKEKSYLLLETTKGKYAIRTNYTKYQDTTLSYSFKKKLGSKRIAGMKAKKLSVTFTDIDKKFTFYYLKNIPAIYGSAYTNFPGLVVEYYIPTDEGMFQYTLTEFKRIDPPLTLFMVPTDYKRVSIEEFMEEMSKP